MKRRYKLTRRTPPCLPDDVLRDGIAWEDDRQEASYRAECQELEKKWQAVRVVEVEITAAWRRDAERQLAEVAPSIERDQNDLLLSRLDEQMAARQAAEDAITAKYLEELAAARDRMWKKQATKRLAAATGNPPQFDDRHPTV